ncbi:MAG: ABC transporter ATP-binding protein/permease, partial [Bacteroidota bacterium]|nr:ABC transporter ATP-binding protein/permease [Bacteroidota bacterium]
MNDSLKKIYRMLSRGEKRLLMVTWILMLFSGVMQVFGIVSIMPFISVVANTSIIHKNKYLSWAYEYFGFTSDLGFLVFLGVLVVVFILLANLSIGTTRWIEARMITHISVKIQNQLLEQYLYKPYQFFLTRNTATLAKTLLGETTQAISGVLIPGIEMVNQAILSLMILILLVVADPILALLSFATLGTLFGTVYYFIRKKLRVIGRQRVQANGRRFKSAQEALSGIKDIKLMGKEQAYLHYFTRAVKSMFKLNERARILQQIPPIIMEVIVMSGIMAMVLYLLISEGSFQEALPIITLFAFAAYRLKPSLQTVFQKWSTIKYSMAALENVIEDIEAEEEGNIRLERTLERLPIRSEILVSKLEFSYPNTERSALKKVDLQIPANTSVAFVGPTGSGKTTLVDVLLGLLKKGGGSIMIDGVELTEKNLRKWQNNIGYIPQHIYLTDDTVAANIAFGTPKDRMDKEAIERSAKAAHLHDFVMELPNGYDTVVGERGVRFSGGQRQRIGIARALYHDPEVLVMDEATSALDNLTEKAVMEAISELSGSKTILMIAHRLTTVENCDIIFLLENGEIVDKGTFTELIEKNDHFRELALSGKE